MSEPAIDVHAHHVPPDFLRRVCEVAARDRFPHCDVKEVQNGGVCFKIGDEPWTRPVVPGLLKIEARTERLASGTVVAQLNAGWLDLFGYSLPPDEGAAWSALLNDTMRESLASASTKDVSYVPLATVPLQDGGLAARELERAASEGHVGAMIGTWIASPGGGRDLDDSDLDPFWACAERLHLPVFVHPVFAGGGNDARIHDLGLANAVARPNETALAMTRLLYGGVLERFPALKLVVAHGGGALPALMGRLARNYELLREAGQTVADPREGFAKLYFDSVVFAPRTLSALLEVCRTDGVMLGSDDPFPIGDPRPRELIEAPELVLAPSTRRAMLYENACATFPGLNDCLRGGSR